MLSHPPLMFLTMTGSAAFRFASMLDGFCESVPIFIDLLKE